MLAPLAWHAFGWDPPAASFTAPASVATATTVVNLDGTGSTDPEGEALTYRWELVSGPNAGTFATPTGSATTFTGTP